MHFYGFLHKINYKAEFCYSEQSEIYHLLSKLKTLHDHYYGNSSSAAYSALCDPGTPHDGVVD